jgi:hypothetical protein
MESTLANFWTWVKQAFTPAYQSEIEEYLAQSTDHFDLENKMKLLRQRGLI